MPWLTVKPRPLTSTLAAEVEATAKLAGIELTDWCILQCAYEDPACINMFAAFRTCVQSTWCQYATLLIVNMVSTLYCA